MAELVTRLGNGLAAAIRFVRRSPLTMAFVVIYVCVQVIAGRSLIRARTQQRQDQATFGDELLGLCAKMADQTEVVPTQIANPRLLVVGKGGGYLHPWHGALPAEWQAKNQDEVDLVLCVGETKETLIQTCRYENTTGTIKRYQASVEVTWVDAATGAVGGRVWIQGRTPGMCPPTTNMVGSTKTGTQPISSDLIDWVEKRFFTPAASTD